MLALLQIAQERPSRLTANKDQDYHVKFGRYCAGQAYNTEHNDWLQRTRVNKMFYKNEQWIMEEDLSMFFLDENNNARNRIKLTNNIIRPMIEQYRGNAIRMSINARCRSISPKSVNRREKKMAEMEFLTELSQNSAFKNSLKRKYPIGDTVEETKQIFNNVYVDNLVKEVNNLLKYVSELNQFEAMQFRVAEQMALSGMAVIQDFEYGGHQRFEVVPSEEFFFDRTALQYDLQDGEFMGRSPLMLPTEIFEQFQIEDKQLMENIENYAKSFNNLSSYSTQYVNQIINGRVPVVFSFWKDSETYTYAYVKDEFGYPYLTRINYIHEGEQAPRYTDADIIKVDTQRAQRVLKGKDKAKLYVDEIRYCIFIPGEVAAGEAKNNKVDIVLEHGILQYQDTELLDISNCKFPFKCFCWSYMDGEVTSPVDDAISPQRLINRISSIAENQINNSGGTGPVYDSSTLPQGGESEMLRNMNQGKPIGFEAKGRGIQNIVGHYDNTPKQGTYSLFNLISTVHNLSQNTTGLNDAIQGNSMGSEQLVGVTELMIQRGSLMQEPFYNAVTQVFMQCYQAIASRGKRIYADNERELAIAVGDDGVEVIRISKELKTEDFRVFVKRENNEEILINAGNQMLTMLLQFKLIDETRFSNLYGRSTPTEVSAELRQAAKENTEKARMKNQADQAAVADQMKQIEQQKKEQADAEEKQFKRNIFTMDRASEHRKEEIAAKSFGKMAENQFEPISIPKRTKK